MEQQNPPRRGVASRVATALASLVILASALAGMWVATDDAASVDDDKNQGAAFPRETGIGACLTVAGRVADAQPLVDALTSVATANEHFFPALGVTTTGQELDMPLVVALWPNGVPAPREAATEARDTAVCPSFDNEVALTIGAGWVFAISHDLLSDGADRLLAQADFGSDWTAEITVLLRPHDRVRTKLDFGGPLGISGSCWIDESLFIDLETDLPGVDSQSKRDAGLPGLVACAHFEDELAAGGAGAQALALFPAFLATEGADVTLGASHVEVTDGLVSISGRTE